MLRYMLTNRKRLRLGFELMVCNVPFAHDLGLNWGICTITFQIDVQNILDRFQ